MKKKDKKLRIFTYLLKKHCEKCNESNPVCLEFHHTNPKEKFKSISQLIRENYEWHIIENEIKKCKILCSNCHKKETAYDNKWYKMIAEEYWEENSVDDELIVE